MVKAVPMDYGFGVKPAETSTYEESVSLKRMGENAREAAKNFDKKVALNSFYNMFSKWAESSKG